jgi:hypothetical protein
VPAVPCCEAAVSIHLYGVLVELQHFCYDASAVPFARVIAVLVLHVHWISAFEWW